ncbi:MAG: hypothetical protein FJ267_12930 [Planctomycetes bacterium]|nr:hypothetical protein [Planctomycetota bacterium]
MSLIAAGEATANSVRLSTSPFSSQSYGYNRLIEQPAHDPALATALAATARKQLGGTIPKLRFTCPPESKFRTIARSMVEHWKQVGIDVELTGEGSSSTESSDETWDLCYRSAQHIEPITELWPLLTVQPDARIAALQTLPDRTRLTLLELERAIDWTSTTSALQRLLADLLTEARFIPLWEIDEYMVARKNINGIPSLPMHLYDDIERWTVQPWYPTETP